MTKDDLAILKAIRDGMADETEQSPGHWHEKPGVWDSNGKPCKWCANWRKFTELIERLEKK